MPIKATSTKKSSTKKSSSNGSSATTKFQTAGEIVATPSGKGGYRTAPENTEVLAGPFYLSQSLVKKLKLSEGDSVKVTIEKA